MSLWPSLEEMGLIAVWGFGVYAEYYMLTSLAEPRSLRTLLLYPRLGFQCLHGKWLQDIHFQLGWILHPVTSEP